MHNSVIETGLWDCHDLLQDLLLWNLDNLLNKNIDFHSKVLQLSLLIRLHHWDLLVVSSPGRVLVTCLAISWLRPFLNEDPYDLMAAASLLCTALLACCWLRTFRLLLALLFPPAVGNDLSNCCWLPSFPACCWLYCCLFFCLSTCCAWHTARPELTRPPPRAARGTGLLDAGVERLRHPSPELSACS